MNYEHEIKTRTKNKRSKVYNLHWISDMKAVYVCKCDGLSVELSMVQMLDAGTTRKWEANLWISLFPTLSAVWTMVQMQAQPESESETCGFPCVSCVCVCVCVCV